MNTIVALATSVGRSAIGVVRLSGPQSLHIAQSLIAENYSPSHAVASLHTIIDPIQHDIVDRALVTFFKSPHSFTGEDVIEISCHGSPVVLRRVLDLILERGARIAEPGEFTLRALSNGKMNLSQAEAIRDLIDARTTGAARQALRQLEGELSSQLAPMKDRLLQIIVLLESALEFVEDDLPELQLQSVSEELGDIRQQLNDLAGTYSVGHLFSDGLKVVIAGRPNVGKSSLFNSLLGRERVIVTATPGTTRDSVNEQVDWDGIPVLLTDTAGIREAGDDIESMGIERTHRVVADADLVMVVIDGSQNLTEEDVDVLTRTKNAPRVIALNKSDLDTFENSMNAHLSNGSAVVELSARTGLGLDNLRAAILKPFGSLASESAGLLITNARHHDLLRRSSSEVESSIRLLEGKASEELVLVGLHNGLRMLGEITGETTTEDILSKIFSTFCIGK